MRLAVLIPAYNEALVIKQSLVSCLNAGIRREDIYVVDDGSRDQTAEAARRYGVNVREIDNVGKARALKAGLDWFELAARYSHIMILDADSALTPEYLPAMRKAVKAHPDGVLFSSVQVSQRSKHWNAFTAYRAMEYTVFGGIVREAQHLLGTITIVPGPGSLFRSDVFASLPFDNLTLIEDIEWTCILQRRGEGSRIWYVPEATILTQDPATFRDFCGQLTRWNRGIWQVIKRYKLGRQRQRIDFEWMEILAQQLIISPLFLALIPIWLFVSPRTEVIWLGVDQGILFTFALLTAIRQRRLDVIAMFPAFFFLRCVGWFLFMRAYLLERRRVETAWYTVARRAE